MQMGALIHAESRAVVCYLCFIPIVFINLTALVLHMFPFYSYQTCFMVLVVRYYSLINLFLLLFHVCSIFLSLQILDKLYVAAS